MSAFDGLAASIVGITGVVFGDLVTWVKDVEHTYSGMGKFQQHKHDPKQTIGNVGNISSKQFPIDEWLVEVVKDEFPGLMKSIQQNNKLDLTINIRGVDTVYVTTGVNALSDGRCILVNLRPKI